MMKLKSFCTTCRRQSQGSVQSSLTGSEDHCEDVHTAPPAHIHLYSTRAYGNSANSLLGRGNTLQNLWNESSHWTGLT